MYKIVITQRAAKDFKSLDTVVKKFLFQKLKLMETAPFDQSIKLKDKNLGTYRYKAGDYRIIFDLDKDKLIILRIGHRKEIYK
jgi:mRNA interferase RelE/StbE